MQQKIMRNRDIIFLKDQTIDDFKKPNKPKSTLNNMVDLCLDTSLRSLDNGGAIVNDGIYDSHETEKSTDGVQIELHIESPI